MLTQWLEQHGFEYNPFDRQIWVSEADRRLFSYFVYHPLVDILLRSQHIWIIAEPGSGKTALRRYATNLLWERLLSSSHRRPFPVTLYLQSSSGHPHQIAQYFWNQWLQRIALNTLLLCFYQVQNSPLQVLDTPLQRVLFSLWKSFLLGGIGGAQDLVIQARQTQDLSFLYGLYQWDFSLYPTNWTPDPQALNLLENLLARVEEDVSFPLKGEPSHAKQVWELLQSLGVTSFYVFIDGLDNFPQGMELLRPSSGLVRFIEQLLGTFSEKELSLKIFFPDEVEHQPIQEVLDAARIGWIEEGEIREIYWSSSLLREVVDRRIAVATNEQLLGLDDLIAVEEVGLLSRELARRARTPRQILQMVYYLFKAAAALKTDVITETVVRKMFKQVEVQSHPFFGG